MIILKIILAFSFILFFKFNGCGQKNKLNNTEVNIKYEHFIFKYNEKDIKFTSTINYLHLFEVFDYGFHDYNDIRIQVSDDVNPILKKAGNYMVNYTNASGVDTINIVKWFDSRLPETEFDSIQFLKKARYAFVLYKSDEKRLNIDNVPKIRMIFHDENSDERWLVTKVCFYPNTTPFTKKRSDIKDYTGRKVDFEITTKLKNKKRTKLLAELEKLRQYKGYEYDYKDFFEDGHNSKYLDKRYNYGKFGYLTHDYRELIEYFDGTTEYTFIMPPEYSLKNKELRRIYDNIISLIY